MFKLQSRKLDNCIFRHDRAVPKTDFDVSKHLPYIEVKMAN